MCSAKFYSRFGMKVHQFEFFTEESRQSFERLLEKAKDKYSEYF